MSRPAPSPSTRSVGGVTGLIGALFVAFVAVFFAAPASAQDGCAWYGSRPFCDGQCPGGTVYTGQRESCVTGSRRYCCPSWYIRNSHGLKNCQWVGKPGGMLYVCDDPQSVPYAAVASDSKGRWGASIMPPSLNGPLDTNDRARSDARRRCGPGCSVLGSGKGQCVAVVESKAGGYWIGFAYGTSRQFVIGAATKGCTDRAPGGTCSLSHANCL
jgi:hypothetical protein